MINEGVGNALQGLVHVRVVKIYARVLAFPLGGIDEVLHASGLVLNLVDTYGKRSREKAVQPRAPEGILHLHLGEIDLTHHLVNLLSSFRLATGTYHHCHRQHNHFLAHTYKCFYSYLIS